MLCAMLSFSQQQMQLWALSKKVASSSQEPIGALLTSSYPTGLEAKTLLWMSL